MERNKAQTNLSKYSNAVTPIAQESDITYESSEESFESSMDERSVSSKPQKVQVKEQKDEKQKQSQKSSAQLKNSKDVRSLFPDDQEDPKLIKKNAKSSVNL